MLAAGCGAALAAGTAGAQSSPALKWGEGSLAPSHGYLGVHLGKSEFEPDCLPGLSCDDGETAFKLTAGGIASETFSAEIGYLNMGKIGTTYGWTDTSSNRPGISTGSEKGFGLSYGLGIGYRLTPQFEVVGEYERHNFDFAPGDQTLDLLSVGLRYQY